MEIMGIGSVAAITVICYLVGMTVRQTGTHSTAWSCFQIGSPIRTTSRGSASGSAVCSTG